MKFKLIALILLFIFSCLITTTGFAAPPSFPSDITSASIIKYMDDLLRGKTSEGKYQMLVHTPRWERSIEMLYWSKGRNKMLIKITAPAKDRGTSFLKIDYQFWNYVPAIEKTIKLPPSMMLQSWMGSDFTNDDLVKESSIVHDYTNKLEGTKTIDGVESYKIRLDPKPNAPVTWGKIIYYSRKKDLLPVREEFYNEKGELVNVLTFSDYKNVGDRTIPTHWKMVPVKKKDRFTIINLEKTTYDKKIPDSMFTLKELKKGL